MGLAFFFHDAGFHSIRINIRWDFGSIVENLVIIIFLYHFYIEIEIFNF